MNISLIELSMRRPRQWPIRPVIISAATSFFGPSVSLTIGDNSMKSPWNGLLGFTGFPVMVFLVVSQWLFIGFEFAERRFSRYFFCFDFVVPNVTGFYWVLPSFTEFYLGVEGFTGSCRVLRGLTRFYWVLVCSFRQCGVGQCVRASFMTWTSKDNVVCRDQYITERRPLDDR